MEYLYTPRYCYISPLCFTAQRRLEVHNPPPRPRATPQAALEAAAAAPLCAGGEDGAAPAPGTSEPPRRVRPPQCGPAGAGGARLAEQHRLPGAREPDEPPACGGSRTTGQHAGEGRGWVAAAVGSVPHVLQLWLPSRPSMPSAAAARAAPGYGLGHAVASPNAGEGGWGDGSGGEPA
jgi:hypothetical protein